MANVKLYQTDQSSWVGLGGGPSRGGVCYYLCNYVESDNSLWNAPGTFATAVANAKNFRTTIAINSAKAQNLRKAPQTDLSSYNATTLNTNTIYRIALYIGSTAGSAPNHEIMAVTGTGNDIAYFDPNFGFWQPSEAGLSNKQALEKYVADQNGGNASNFQYMSVRAINKTTPLSFK